MAFSSASSRIELSQSKMPPEQAQGLLNLRYSFDGFGAHIECLSNQMCCALNRSRHYYSSTRPKIVAEVVVEAAAEQEPGLKPEVLCFAGPAGLGWVGLRQ